MQKRRCSTCGKEDYEHKMHEFNTGRKQWLCEDCYKEGSRQAKYQGIDRDVRIRKEKKWR